MIKGYDGSIDDIGNGTELAILSLGSIEQHGPHMSIITDWVIADAMGRGVAEKTGGMYVPAFPVSTNREALGKRGAVGMHSDVFYAMLRDVCLNLKATGFRKIAIIQAHGGIFSLTPIVRELNADCNPELMVAKLDMIETCWPKYQKLGITETTDTELHAGEAETSFMLYLAPALVDMSKAVDFVPDIKRSDLNYGGFLRYSPSGVWGHPRCATAEKGKKLLEFSVEETVREMNRIFALMEAKKPMNGCNF